MPPADTSPRYGAGIGLMLFGIAMFSLNDAMGKWLVATYSVGAVLLIRSLAALVLLAPFIWRDRAHFKIAPRWGLQILRAVLATLEVGAFYWAVTYLPLADVMTYYLAGPVYVTAISAVLLKEQVGWRRWSAVIAGFIGVVIALNPSAATFTWPALIALGGSVIFAFLMVTTRYLRGTSDTVLITTQTVGALAMGLVLAPVGWVTPSPFDFAMLSLLGVVAMVAHVCVNRSLKITPASVVVPYQYTMIVWAIVLGYAFFGDIPTMAVLIGAALIVAAGLFIFFREQVRAKTPTVMQDPPA